MDKQRGAGLDIWVSGPQVRTVLYLLSPFALKRSGEHSYQSQLRAFRTSFFHPASKDAKQMETSEGFNDLRQVLC